MDRRAASRREFRGRIRFPEEVAACDLFGAARDKGFGDRDISAVVRALTDL